MTNNIDVLNNGDIVVNLLLLRLTSQLIGGIGVCIYFYLGYKYIKSLPLTICYASIVTLVPMFAYGLAGVSNDALALLGVPILFLGMCRFEEGIMDQKTFLLIAAGVFISGMAKLTCGMIIAVTGMFYFLYLTHNRKIKQLYCKAFARTVPIYLIMVGYYLYIWKSYGCLQPTITRLDHNYAEMLGFYIRPENRQQMGFWKYARTYCYEFCDTWISIRSHINLSKGGRKIFGLEGIGLFSIVYFSFFGAVICFFGKRGEKRGANIKISLAFLAGMMVTMLYQFYDSYTKTYLVNGRVGGYQSRYYLCCIGAIAFLCCYFFDFATNKIFKTESEKDDLVLSMCGCIMAGNYAMLLLNNDIIYFLNHFVDYL